MKIVFAVLLALSFTNAAEAKAQPVDINKFGFQVWSDPLLYQNKCDQQKVSPCTISDQREAFPYCIDTNGKTGQQIRGDFSTNITVTSYKENKDDIQVQMRMAGDIILEQKDTNGNKIISKTGVAKMWGPGYREYKFWLDFGTNTDAKVNYYQPYWDGKNIKSVAWQKSMTPDHLVILKLNSTAQDTVGATIQVGMQHCRERQLIRNGQVVIDEKTGNEVMEAPTCGTDTVETTIDKSLLNYAIDGETVTFTVSKKLLPAFNAAKLKIAYTTWFSYRDDLKPAPMYPNEKAKENINLMRGCKSEDDAPEWEELPFTPVPQNPTPVVPAPPKPV